MITLKDLLSSFVIGIERNEKERSKEDTVQNRKHSKLARIPENKIALSC